MHPKPLTVQPPLGVEKKVTIAIYKLAICDEYRIVANAFGVAKELLTNAFINFAGMNCFAVTPLFLDNAYANRLIAVQLSDMYFC